MRILRLLIIAFLVALVRGGPLAAGLCYTGCNAVWVACVSAAGGVAGVSTGGIGVAPAILACNAA